MLRSLMGLTVVLLILALVAGFFGFVEVGGLTWEAGRMLFFILLGLATMVFFCSIFIKRSEA